MANDSANRARVLLVEDDHSDAMLLREMLRAGWDGELVVSHTDRLSAASRELGYGGTTCVLLSATLPDGFGLTGLDHIRAGSPAMPVVLLTDERDEALELEALRRGAQDVLFKRRTDPATLARSVKHAIERQGHGASLAHQALHDAVTGLPNRALLMDRLKVSLDRSRRTHSPVSVMFLDVDDFKGINDRYGHAAGDRLLTALGERLRDMLRPNDTVARFGGDEFALLFEDLESERETVLIADRIGHAASRPVPLEQGDVSVTVSIGIAIVTDPTITPERLLSEADEAMYRAKATGPAHYELFDEAARRRADARLEREARLQQALEAGELTVHYQPRLSFARDSAVVGFEALVRWQHPERGLLPPSEFMPLAEETGLVVKIGEFVLEQSLAQLGRWRELRPEVTISVNLSVRQLNDGGLLPMVGRTLRATGADPASLCLEISESDWGQIPETVVRTLTALRSLGVQIAFDDYGTGSSSITHLDQLPIDRLKIHESFVSALDDNGNAEAAGSVVGSVITLAHALGLSAVAEGVETPAQLEHVRRLGCDEAQGYLIGRPMSDREISELLTEPAR